MNIQDKIDSYIENNLSPQERKIFEEELANNEELALEVARRKLINRILKKLLTYPSLNINKDKHFELSTIQNIEIEEDILKFYREYEISNDETERNLINLIAGKKTDLSENNTKSLWLFLKIAASFIIFIFLSVSIIYYLNSENTRKIVVTSQTICEAFPSDKDSLLKNMIYSAIILRQANQNGIESPKSFNSVPEDKSAQILKLTDAIRNLENSNLYDARLQFQSLPYSEYEDLNAAIKWYYSLLCLREKNIQEAIAVLRDLKEDKSYYYDNAQKLLKIISK